MSRVAVLSSAVRVYSQVGNWLEHFFSQLRDLYQELKPCRFSFIVAAIGAVVFCCVEQGREILRALAEPGKQTGVTGAVRLSMFAAGLLAWSLANWYSA